MPEPLGEYSRIKCVREGKNHYLSIAWLRHDWCKSCQACSTEERAHFVAQEDSDNEERDGVQRAKFTILIWLLAHLRDSPYFAMAVNPVGPCDCQPDAQSA